MLQSVFEDKPAKIYSALSSEKSSDYDTVKQEVLKAYELMPETYRQKFRSYKKRVQAVCSFGLKTHLDDKTVETLQDAAVISDYYTLSHKRSFKGQNFNTSSGNYKNQSTERIDSKPVAQNKSQSSYNMFSPKFDTFEKMSLTCAYCKKNGHLMADCFRLQKNE
ncbi:unnamed protein product [Mytilus coruscus]|uniref:CCHC-type domain-containing protein n=1 Tax=Mytilus coruscus TaxID=42192 RepID=A0A6J8AF59_MYTCO|nr:unnamed protein product [Mytilus coruscus]